MESLTLLQNLCDKTQRENAVLKNEKEELKLQNLQHERDAQGLRSEIEVLQRTNTSQSEQLTILSASNESLKAKENTLTEEVDTHQKASSKMTEAIAKARLLLHYTDALSRSSCFSCNKRKMHWPLVSAYLTPASSR